MLSIGILGFIVWAHHMYTVVWMLIHEHIYSCYYDNCSTNCIKIFSWLATMWGGTIEFKTPMLFALGFIFYLQ